MSWMWKKPRNPEQWLSCLLYTSIGKCNVSADKAFIIGNGTYDKRSNALTVDWSGNITAPNLTSPGAVSYTHLPTSTVNRGREIVHRETDPQFSGEPTNRQVKDYATSLLSQLSSVEYTISYSHGYCPVRLYDCVRLNYERAGLMDIKACLLYTSRCV